MPMSKLRSPASTMEAALHAACNGEHYEMTMIHAAQSDGRSARPRGLSEDSRASLILFRVSSVVREGQGVGQLVTRTTLTSSTTR